MTSSSWSSARAGPDRERQAFLSETQKLLDEIDQRWSRLRAAQAYLRGEVGTPPLSAKHKHLLALFQERGLDVLVESGTFHGDTVAVFVPNASRIISVEIDETHYHRVCERFAGTPNVELVLGDALHEIPRIAATLDEPALFWLDGHFSGGTSGRGKVDEPAPAILARLGALGLPARTTVVIDDLRLFGAEFGFPSLPELINAAHDAFPEAQIVAGFDSLVVRA